MTEHWHDHVDIYCERTDPTFWAEPINAISNLAFLIAALFAYRLYSKSNIKAPAILVAIIMVAIVGTGSFIFHTFATVWAEWVDVIPILVSILFMVFLIMRNVFTLSILLSSLIAVVVMLLSFFAKDIIPLDINGSQDYLPILSTLILITIASRFYAPLFYRDILIASLVLALSVTIRSLDMIVCDTLPIGIHYLWHTLNGIMYFYLLKGLIAVQLATSEQ